MENRKDFLETILLEQTLSGKAKTIISILYLKREEKLSILELKDFMSEGQTAIISAVKELKESGYVTSEVDRGVHANSFAKHYLKLWNYETNKV